MLHALLMEESTKIDRDYREKASVSTAHNAVSLAVFSLLATSFLICRRGNSCSLDKESDDTLDHFRDWVLVSGLQVGVWLALLHQMEYHESEVCDLDIRPEESSFLQLQLLTHGGDIEFQVLKCHSIVEHRL